MQHHIEQASPFLKRKNILTHQIKHQTIGNNTIGTHRTALIVVIKTLVQSIIFSHVLIQANAQQRIGQDYRLIKCGYLRINKRYFYLKNLFFQFLETFRQAFFHFVQIRETCLHIGHQTKQGSIRIECLKFLRNGIVTHLS